MKIILQFIFLTNLIISIGIPNIDFSEFMKVAFKYKNIKDFLRGFLDLKENSEC